MGEAANEWTKRKIREAFKNARPVKGRIRVPEETTGYIVGLEKENDRLRARVARLEADKARLVAALEPFARHANNKLVADAAFMKQAVGVNYGGSSFALPAVYFKDARAELDAMKESTDER